MAMSDDKPIATTIVELSGQLIGLSGKVDAYMAGQSARLDDHARRLAGHDEALDDLRATATTHVTREELAERLPVKPTTSGWQIAATVISAVVGLGSLLTLVIMLMRIVAGLP